MAKKASHFEVGYCVIAKTHHWQQLKLDLEKKCIKMSSLKIFVLNTDKMKSSVNLFPENKINRHITGVDAVHFLRWA
jgi:hypothetical protein